MSVIELKQKNKPGRKGVNYEEFIAAVNAIIARGETLDPTIKAIKAELGKGSEELLCRYKRQWHEETVQEKVEIYKLPTDLEIAVALSISDQVSKETESLSMKLNANRSDLASLQERSEELSDRNKKLRKDILQEQLKSAKMEGLLEQLQRENADLKQQLEEEQKKVVALAAENSSNETRKELHSALYVLNFAHEDAVN